MKELIKFKEEFIMNKFKNWCVRPITRGDYLKACAISVVAVLIEMAVVFGYVSAVYEKLTELGGKLFHHKKQPEIEE